MFTSILRSIKCFCHTSLSWSKLFALLFCPLKRNQMSWILFNSEKHCTFKGDAFRWNLNGIPPTVYEINGFFVKKRNYFRFYLTRLLWVLNLVSVLVEHIAATWDSFCVNNVLEMEKCYKISKNRFR